MQLQTGDQVIVCDGGKYIIYENQGDAVRMDLRVVTAKEQDNPPTQAQGSDRPGRYPGPSGQMSSVEQTDWHDEAEKRFIAGLAKQVAESLSRHPKNQHIVIADPRSVGVLRANLDAKIAQDQLHILTANLTKHPVDKVEAYLKGA